MGIIDITRGIRALIRYSPPLLHRMEVEDENGYVIHAQKEVTSGGGTLAIHIGNETDGLSVDVVSIEYSADFDGTYSMYDTFSSDPTGGTSNGVDNLVLDTNGEDDNSDMTVSVDPDFTDDGTKHVEIPVLTGGAKGLSQAQQGRGTKPIIEPGRHLVIELENTSTSAGRAGFVVTYHELERVPSEERSILSKLKIA